MPATDMEHDEGISIAGMTFSPLLTNLEDLEFSFAELALFPAFASHFSEALELIELTQSAWLEESGSWPDNGPSICLAVFHLRHTIYEHNLYRGDGYLAEVIRNLILMEPEATDSQLVAAYVAALVVDAIQSLSNWLEKIESTVQAIDPSLLRALRQNAPDEYVRLVERERWKQAGEEIGVREEFAQALGDARHVLILVNLYREAEVLNVEGAPGNLVEQLKNVALAAFNKSRRLQTTEAGLKSGTDRRKAAADRDDLICKKGQQLLKSGYSAREISGMIAGMEVAEKENEVRLSAKQVRTILRKGHVIPNNDEG